ncbi:hypothetical protein DFJ74DRAFT_643448 [Hyaloraphidium curvatum]|nr:hypothetical protein DFJ74DRAFT_643448 [Hyaloraphidium curvatum]
MLRAAAALAALLLTLAVVAAPAAAAPSPQALFRRSCAECDADFFCEFAFPGAREGHVACVAYAPGGRHLYRRYESVFTPCPIVPCTFTVASNPGYLPQGECVKQCAASATCVAALENPVGCRLLSAMSEKGAPNIIEGMLTVKGTTCPAFDGPCQPN